MEDCLRKDNRKREGERKVYQGVKRMLHIYYEHSVMNPTKHCLKVREKEDG
jgi:hypothetical protein